MTYTHLTPNELVIIEAYFHLGEEPKKQLTPR